MAGPAEDPPPIASRALLAFGLALLFVTALVSVWEGLALQSPVSAVHLGVLVGPITQLRNGCFAFGVGACLLASAWPQLFPRADINATFALLLSGALLQLGALCYAASAGIVAVQLNDPRVDARVALYARLAAHALTSAGLFSLCTRAVRTLRVAKSAR